MKIDNINKRFELYSISTNQIEYLFDKGIEDISDPRHFSLVKQFSEFLEYFSNEEEIIRGMESYNLRNIEYLIYDTQDNIILNWKK